MTLKQALVNGIAVLKNAKIDSPIRICVSESPITCIWNATKTAPMKIKASIERSLRIQIFLASPTFWDCVKVVIF